MGGLGEFWVSAVISGQAEGTIYHPIFHPAVYTGLRRSELLGLRWKHIDLDLASLSVVQTLHHLRDGRLIFQEPKTGKGRRLVALSPTAVLALRAHREQKEAESTLLGISLTGDSLVFSQPEGSPIDPERVSQAWRRTARKSGLAGVTFKDLCHTHATLMLKANIHPKIVSERLGHASVSTTLDIYSPCPTRTPGSRRTTL